MVGRRHSSLHRVAACYRSGTMIPANPTDFGTRYTAAWCSQDAASVAQFYALNGSLAINSGAPAVGREAIAGSAQSFMTAFPDLVVSMDGIDLHEARVVYWWTLTGTNTGPGGTGHPVRVSGREEWQFGADGLVGESLGFFDSAEYDRQLAGKPLIG